MALGYAMTTYQDKNRIEWMRFLESIMDTSCALCGYNRSMNALVFHHVKLSKDNVSVGKFIATQAPTEKSKEKVLNEIKKCILLCSNCRKEVLARDREIIAILKD